MEKTEILGPQYGLRFLLKMSCRDLSRLNTGLRVEDLDFKVLLEVVSDFSEPIVLYRKRNKSQQKVVPDNRWWRGCQL